MPKTTRLFSAVSIRESVEVHSEIDRRTPKAEGGIFGVDLAGSPLKVLVTGWLSFESARWVKPFFGWLNWIEVSLFVLAAGPVNLIRGSVTGGWVSAGAAVFPLFFFVTIVVPLVSTATTALLLEVLSATGICASATGVTLTILPVGGGNGLGSL